MRLLDSDICISKYKNKAATNLYFVTALLGWREGLYDGFFFPFSALPSKEHGNSSGAFV